ncbi:phosphatidylinositol-specific phospholipase C [Pectobacteriaceae bacterium CE70]|nr:phosphatidylinositol-specific phospholipase C [Pectobacteriaceae bacterium C52]WJV67901.1 phosphatidylinositol-specific phospholipase C [Pectobacteriaceae bacterium CE70]WJY11846.1 phosphatidylinositol-specific phospholipase C [Pectobacteriaceae bacterium C80]
MGNKIVPKFWDSIGDVGDIYYYPEYGYYFKFLNSGNPADHYWYFPTKPESNSTWEFLPRYANGDTSGRYNHPKSWNEYGDSGDIYFYSEYGYYFEFLQSGNPADHYWYFPTEPESNNCWRYLCDLAVKPRGSYQNPRNWNEYGEKGDIYYYPGYQYYFEFLNTGNPANHNWYFPTSPKNDPNNWKFSGGFNLGLKDWMASIPDNFSLSYMSIPGTHDSCTYTYDDALQKGWVRTQNWSIIDQLNNGIRFLDLRCGKYSDENLGMYHADYYLNVKLTDVLSVCESFLEQHPFETILVRIKKEGPSLSDSDFINMFNTNISNYASHIWQENRTPTLGEIRKKIAIISQVSGLNGIQWDNLDIEDDSQGDVFTSYIDRKIKEVKDHLNKASTEHEQQKNAVFVTFLSMNPGSDVFETNYEISEQVNKAIYEYLMGGISMNSILGNGDMPYLGIIPMDFPDNYSGIITSAIKFNNHVVISKGITTVIFNTYYSNYIYASSLLEDRLPNENGRRKVVGWEEGTQVSQDTWTIIPALDNFVYFYNTYYKEIMFATNYAEGGRRIVCTWIDGLHTGVDDAFLWELGNNGNGTFTIKNKKYPEYFYASSINDGKGRREARCWHTGGMVIQGDFDINY